MQLWNSFSANSKSETPKPLVRTFFGHIYALNEVTLYYINTHPTAHLKQISHNQILSNASSDGSDPRIGPGSARDRPFLEGSGSNFREGPKLGIGSGSISRIEGPEGPKNLLKLTK